LSYTGITEYRGGKEQCSTCPSEAP